MGLFSFLNNKRISIPNPNKYEIITQVKGDLDMDGNDEIIVVFNTNETTPFGKPRLIQIFKINNFKTTLWIESNFALKRSEENGVKENMVEILIEKGDLIIINSQISNWKLIEQNKYRLNEGEFKLVEYKSEYGKKDEYWINVNYFPKTGNVEFIKKYEKGDFKTEIDNFKLGKFDLNLKNRTKKAIAFTTPKYQYEWSI